MAPSITQAIPTPPPPTATTMPPTTSMQQPNPNQKQNTHGDLATMDDLSEEHMVSVLKERFENEQIYTNAGRVLVSLNPFTQIETCSNETLNGHLTDHPISHKPAHQQATDERIALPPHIFSVAHDALQTLIRTRQPQVCVMTGESGSGKTEAAKLIVRYLSQALGKEGEITAKTHQAVSVNQVLDNNNNNNNNKNNSNNSDSENNNNNNTIYERLVTCGPLLEAFGNCATVHNNNSSRFLKWLQVFVDPKERVVTRVSIRRFLLEKRRALGVSGANFHIFHHVSEAAKRDATFAGKMQLDTQIPHSLVEGGNNDLSTVDKWSGLISAMQHVGLDEETRGEIFRFISGILLLGDLTFQEEKNGEGSSLGSPQEYLNRLCSVFGFEQDELQTVLCSTPITIAGETLHKPNDSAKAVMVRDVLVMGMYQRLFDWLVATVNISLCETLETRDEKKDGDQVTLSILDVFGFENFVHELEHKQTTPRRTDVEQLNSPNGFSQLLINYCNERLFHELHNQVVTSQVTLYRDQGVNADILARISNTRDDLCLSLIEAKRQGLLSMIDEELRIPGGNDDSLFRKFNKQFSTHEAFTVNKRSVGNFQVVHFAGLVTYSVDGFLRSNKDSFDKRLINFCMSSTWSFCSSSVFTQPQSVLSTERHTSHVTRANTRSLSVGAQFKGELSQLMQNVSDSGAWFITCVKPNRTLSPKAFDHAYMLKQLAYTGITDICHVRKGAFASHIPHKQFVNEWANYIGLKVTSSPTEVMDALVARHPNGPEAMDGWVIGRTLVLLPLNVDEELLRLRDTLLAASAIRIQTLVRGSQACVYVEARRRVKKEKEATKCVQKSWRACRFRMAIVSRVVESNARRAEATRVEAERVEAERVEAKRVEAERVEAERVEAERVEAERVEAERVEAERVEAERVEAERVEAERVEAERVEAERVEAERVEAERVEAERVEAERVEAERVEAERVEAERVEAERLEADRREADRLDADRLDAERVEAERVEAARIVAEQIESQRIEAESVAAAHAQEAAIAKAVVNKAEVTKSTEAEVNADTTKQEQDTERVLLETNTDESVSTSVTDNSEASNPAEDTDEEINDNQSQERDEEEGVDQDADDLADDNDALVYDSDNDSDSSGYFSCGEQVNPHGFQETMSLGEALRILPIEYHMVGAKNQINSTSSMASGSSDFSEWDTYYPRASPTKALEVQTSVSQSRFSFKSFFAAGGGKAKAEKALRRALLTRNCAALEEALAKAHKVGLKDGVLVEEATEIVDEIHANHARQLAREAILMGDLNAAQAAEKLAKQTKNGVMAREVFLLTSAVQNS